VLHNGGYLHHKDAWHGQIVDLYRQAKQRGLITTIDPQFPLYAMQPPWLGALADVLPFIDVLFCDEHEARNMTALDDLADAARKLLDAGAGTVVIKQGADGSTMYSGEMVHHQNAVIVGELVDTIGAGDTYDAAFIYGLLQGWPLEQNMRFASIAAGFSVTGAGGSHSMPELQTILDRL
jgi:2-dehydro-3-deoxygluconokinase